MLVPYVIKKEHARQALFIQNACNFGAIEKAFHEIMCDLRIERNEWKGSEELGWKDEDWMRHHPIVILFMSKFNSMIKHETEFGNAYEAVCAVDPETAEMCRL